MSVLIKKITRSFGLISTRLRATTNMKTCSLTANHQTGFKSNIIQTTEWKEGKSEFLDLKKTSIWSWYRYEVILTL